MSLAMSRAEFESRVKRQDEVRQAVLTALKNEGLTRVRVERLEALTQRRLLGRLKWLLVGK